MIRKFKLDDMDAVLEIWLSASIKAHDFVSPSFWESQLADMRNIYLPSSTVYVYENNARVAGFYALADEHLAAIFVSPEQQGQGIGKAMMAHAKILSKNLTLSVYKDNQPSVNFYLSQGFTIASEQLCEHTGQVEYTMHRLVDKF